MLLKSALLSLFFTQAAFALDPFVFPKHGNLTATLDWLQGPQVASKLPSQELDPASASVVTLAWSAAPGLFRLDFKMPTMDNMAADTFGWKQGPPTHFHSCRPDDKNCSCLSGEQQCPCSPGQPNCNPLLFFSMPSGKEMPYQVCLVLHPYATDIESSCQDLPPDFVK